MAIQGAVEATVTWKEETTFGTLPGATAAARLRRTSSSLSGKKGSFSSNEVRTDQQISDLRHGMRSVAGSLETEIALVSSTPHIETFIAAAMRSNGWVAGVSVAPADFATGMTIANNGDGSTVTFAGAGDLVAKGFKIGDVVRFTGATNAANNTVNHRITALTANVATIFPQAAATAQQAAGWGFKVQGRKCLIGAAKRSFCIEHGYVDAGVWERFSGCRVGGMAINLPPNGMATASFDFMGRDFSTLNAAYFTSPVTEGVGGVMSGVDGRIRIAGTEMGVVTALQLNLQNNLGQPPVIGTTRCPEIFYGRTTVTGSVSVILENSTLLGAFENETEVDIVAHMEASDAAPSDFYAFNIQRAKFSDLQKTLGPDGAVLLQMPFQALLGKALQTTREQSSLVVQRGTTAA